MDILLKRDELKELTEKVEAKKAEIKAEQAKLIQISESKIKDKLEDEIEQLALQLKKETEQYIAIKNSNQVKLDSITRECNEKHKELNVTKKELESATKALTSQSKSINAELEQAKKELMKTQDKNTALDFETIEMLSGLADMEESLEDKTKGLVTLNLVMQKAQNKIKELESSKKELEESTNKAKKELEKINEDIKEGDKKIEEQKYILLTLLAREEKVNDMAKRIKEYYTRAGIQIHDL